MRIEVESTKFPRLTAWHVRRALSWISQSDLQGLETIRVIDECPGDPEYTKVPPYLRGFRYNGHYERKVKGVPAKVVLYASDIYCGIPKVLLVSPMATLRLARTLAHEVGHHVITTRGYIYKPWEKYKAWNGVRNPYEERMAEAYASDVRERMIRHWPYKLGKSMARCLSSFLYQAGLQDYWDGNYQSAAKLLDRAFSLNRENEDAGQGYRHAMEKLRNETPSPLTDAEKEWLTRRYDPTPRRPPVTSLAKKNIASKRRRRRAQS